MIAVCLDSLTAIASPLPKHFGSPSAASAVSTEKEADVVRQKPPWAVGEMGSPRKRKELDGVEAWEGRVVLKRKSQEGW